MAMVWFLRQVHLVSLLTYPDSDVRQNQTLLDTITTMLIYG